MTSRLKAWFDLLETTETKQGYGVLGRSDGRRCCLGVGCDMAVQAGVLREPTPRFGDIDLVYGESITAMPIIVRDWFELPDNLASFRAQDLTRELCDEILAAAKPADDESYKLDSIRKGTGDCCLAMLNDAKVPFPVIAKVGRYVFRDAIARQEDQT